MGWRGSLRAGPSHRALGRHYGWNIEWLYAKLKEFRRVSNRYEKLKKMFLGMIHLALGFIRLRAKVNVNRA